MTAALGFVLRAFVGFECGTAAFVHASNLGRCEQNARRVCRACGAAAGLIERRHRRMTGKGTAIFAEVIIIGHLNSFRDG